MMTAAAEVTEASALSGPVRFLLVAPEIPCRRRSLAWRPEREELFDLDFDVLFVGGAAAVSDPERLTHTLDGSG
ncbi:hypothetical protein [Nocardia sp. NPDC047654]|uniref:hypothetical protein n=1 Tax=Nocardia sp. NPDC047654 TaxID=3364314 RepID=UPI00371DF899